MSMGSTPSSGRAAEVPGPSGQRTGWSLFLVYFAVFGGYAGQQILTPVLPPLARQLSLTEFQLGLVMSTSAGFVALASPFWGRWSDGWGRKPVLTSSLFGSTLALLAFAVAAHLGLEHVLAVPLVFVLLLVTRGVLYGGALAALPVAAQSYVADVTPEERSRVKGLSRVGGSIGLALVLGPALGGLLGKFGLLTALYVAPALLFVVAVAVWAALPKQAGRADRGTSPPKVRPQDPRVWPFLLAGFGIYLSIGLLSMSIGFLIQDRLELDATTTAETTGLALLLGGLPMLFVQGIVVPKLGWSPLRLLRVGIPIAGLAFAVIALAGDLPGLLIGVFLAGLGHSISLPGYNSGPSLLVDQNEQGGVAGLIGSTNATTLVVGPLAATGLYELSPALPYVVGAVLLGGLFLFVLLHPSLRLARREASS